MFFAVLTALLASGNVRASLQRPSATAAPPADAATATAAPLHLQLPASVVAVPAASDDLPSTSDERLGDPPADFADLTPLNAADPPRELTYDSLIHKRGPRPAAVAAWDLGDHLNVRGFGAQTKAGTGYQRLVGSDAVDYALNGVVVENHLSLDDSDQLDIVAGWLSGRADVPGSTPRHGTAWSVATDAALLSRRLTLHAEYAGSQFEWTDAGRLEPRADQAYRVKLEYNAAPTSSMNWRLGSEYSAVGAWFASLANPSLAGDRSSLRSYGRLKTTQWQFDLALERRRNNLADDPSRAIVFSDRLQLSTGWSPDTQPPFALLGRPTVRLAAELGRHRELAAAGTATGGTESRPSANLALQGEFSHDGWLWGWRAKGGRSPLAVDAAVNRGSRVMGFDLYGDFTRGASPLAVKPTLSWQNREDLQTGTRAGKWRAALSSATIALHHDLHAKFDLAYQRQVRSDGTEVDDSAGVGANLVWTLLKPGTNRRGLALALSGKLRDGDPANSGSAVDGDYALMMSLSTENPLGTW